MQVIAVQPDIVWHDKDANHAKVRQLLSGQSFTEDTLIVLPEMFDTGFSMETQTTAQTEDRDSESFLRDLARETGAAVLGGVTSPIIDGRASNEAVGFSPAGVELVRYRKMQLFTPHDEDQHFAKGTGHSVFTWGGVKIAPFVCYDLRFPEVFRPAARDGAELILVIASWPAVRSEHWVRLLQARAIENQAFTIGVNRCGKDPQLEFDGRSIAFSPLGELLFEADSREQICSVNIEADEVRNWRATFPALADMRLE